MKTQELRGISIESELKFIPALNSTPGGRGAHPMYWSFDLQITQAGAQTEPGTQNQPMSLSQPQRP